MITAIECPTCKTTIGVRAVTVVQPLTRMTSAASLTEYRLFDNDGTHEIRNDYCLGKKEPIVFVTTCRA
jgi:hypothetical protein